MNKISAKIIADSVNSFGNRITTFELVFPRFILAELNTHRLFSRNSASSRAIPFKKMVEAVKTNPFIPIAWQKDHRGMQGTKYFEYGKDALGNCVDIWLRARDNAVIEAEKLNEYGVTKQLCNRLLEPFMYHKVLLTATEFENFFNLRCPQYPSLYVKDKYYKSWKDFLSSIEDTQTYIHAAQYNDLQKLQNNKGQSEIHMMTLAEAMWDAYNESTPKKLKAGEYHIPYGDDIDLKKLFLEPIEGLKNLCDFVIENSFPAKIKIATARCARVSYQTLGDNPKIDYEADIKLHDSLLSSGHYSPFEHCAQAMDDKEYATFFKGERYSGNHKLDKGFGWCNNFKGFIPYRYFIENKLDI